MRVRVAGNNNERPALRKRHKTSKKNNGSTSVHPEFGTVTAVWIIIAQWIFML